MDRDTAVDRRLVTNILLSFLNAPRGDAKRFEMLKVLSDILGWGETEREKAGLQRAGGLSRAPSKASTDGLEKTDETEVSRSIILADRALIKLRVIVILANVGRVSAHSS